MPGKPSRKNQIKDIEVSCDLCGKTCYISRENRRKSKSHYCSKQCQYLDMAKSKREKADDGQSGHVRRLFDLSRVYETRCGFKATPVYYHEHPEEPDFPLHVRVEVDDTVEMHRYTVEGRWLPGSMDSELDLII